MSDNSPNEPEAVAKHRLTGQGFIDYLIIRSGKSRKEIVEFLDIITRGLVDATCKGVVSVPGLGKFRGEAKAAKHYDINRKAISDYTKVNVKFDPEKQFFTKVKNQKLKD